MINSADDIWPDLMLLLSAGKVVVKNYEVHDSFIPQGYLTFIDAGEDALLYFTAALMALITARVEPIEDPLYLGYYVTNILNNIPREIIEFPVRKIHGSIGFNAP